MPNFGKTSKRRLKTCHPYLRLIMEQVIKERDCTILQYGGFRSEKDQNRLLIDGKSQVGWPNSNHNNTFGNKPYSLAVDVAPWPVNWNNINEFKELGEIILKKAKQLGIKLNWGGNWKSFKDYPHYELDKSMLD